MLTKERREEIYSELYGEIDETRTDVLNKYIISRVRPFIKVPFFGGWLVGALEGALGKLQPDFAYKLLWWFVFWERPPSQIVPMPPKPEVK